MQCRFKVWTQPIALLLAAGLSAAGGAASAAVPETDPGSEKLEIGDSQPGNYLSALIASADRDTLAAEVYYREVLRADPRNPDLLERAFAAALSNGDEPSANALAERLLARDPGNSLARLSIAVHDIEQGQYAAARAQLAYGDVRSRDVTAGFLTAWCYAGQSDLRRALDALDRIRDPSVAAFRDYHAGLISDFLGNPTEARRRLKAAYEDDKNTLRFVDAYARFRATHGDLDEARKVYTDFSAVVPRHPLIERALANLRAGQPLESPIRSAK